MYLLGKPLWQLGLLPLLLGLLLIGCEGKQEKLKIGDRAPDFSAQALDGKPLSLEEYAGQPVILRFWSTDCKYCRADTPIFNRYFERYRDQGLRVVYINTTSPPEEVREFVKDLEIGFPVVLDSRGSIAEKYQVKVVPQTIVLSPEHRIIAALLGGVSEAELQDLLGVHLKE